jgi:hypothetical protein
MPMVPTTRLLGSLFCCETGLNHTPPYAVLAYSAVQKVVSA